MPDYTASLTSIIMVTVMSKLCHISAIIRIWFKTPLLSYNYIC